jgi:hypothetical protein
MHFSPPPSIDDILDSPRVGLDATAASEKNTDRKLFADAGGAKSVRFEPRLDRVDVEPPASAVDAADVISKPRRTQVMPYARLTTTSASDAYRRSWTDGHAPDFSCHDRIERAMRSTYAILRFAGLLRDSRAARLYSLLVAALLLTVCAFGLTPAALDVASGAASARNDDFSLRVVFVFWFLLTTSTNLALAARMPRENYLQALFATIFADDEDPAPLVAHRRTIEAMTGGFVGVNFIFLLFLLFLYPPLAAVMAKVVEPLPSVESRAFLMAVNPILVINWVAPLFLFCVSVSVS